VVGQLHGLPCLLSMPCRTHPHACSLHNTRTACLPAYLRAGAHACTCLPACPPALRCAACPPALQVYGCPIGGTLTREPWTTDGSGSTFLWGFLGSEFRWGSGLGWGCVGDNQWWRSAPRVRGWGCKALMLSGCWLAGWLAGRPGRRQRIRLATARTPK